MPQAPPTSESESAANASAPAAGPEPVAIVGIGCRFPGAENLAAFWRLLRDGEEAVGDIPLERFPELERLLDPARGPGKVVSRRGGYFKRIDEFDAAAFGLAPREAVWIDPQHRLLLETAWEALEDAGQSAERLAALRGGVFVGQWTNDFEMQLYRATPNVDVHMTTGSGRCAACGRLSFVFNLRGPSVAVDTGCSSALVAVHLACTSLRAGECDLALAGGVNLILQPPVTVAYSHAGMLSADGRCKFGDARADGYVRSEGCGMIALKRLSRALADGDPIHALIRGSAVNNDGQLEHFVTPSQQGQEELLRQAYRDAGLSPGSVHYVEAHGTGTAVGDPVETQSLGAVLGEGRAPERPCLVGSVKTNIGHTESAAGIAGLIKAVLCLEHRQVPPSLHLQNPNPNIPWERLPLRVATELCELPVAPGEVARAGVNSFGVTGTNAHAVLEEAPKGLTIDDGRLTIDRIENENEHEHENAASNQQPLTGNWQLATDNSPLLLPLSACAPEALEAQARNWREFLTEADDSALADICYTASARRTHREYRLAVVGGDRAALAAQLDDWLETKEIPGLEPAGPRVAFVLCGQGPQWPTMGCELLEREPVFRETVERCAELLKAHVDWSLLDELAAAAADSRIHQTAITQPAIFAVQVALGALWRSWGVEPAVIIGHSAGEVAAAHLAGALSLEDAMRVIFHRGRISQAAVSDGDGMAAAELTREEAEGLAAAHEGRLFVAAINGPSSVTFSGDVDALEKMLEALEQKGRFGRMLKVKFAAHSSRLDPYKDDFVSSLQGLAPRAPHTPLISTVTGEAACDFGPEYWARNIREPVAFAPALDALIQDGCTTFLELAPHPVLSASIGQCLERRACRGTVLGSLRREEGERENMLTTLAQLYARGQRVDWRALYPAGGRCVSLPAYPWQRERHWPEFDELKAAAPLEELTSPLGRRHSSATAPERHFWEREISLAALPELRDHRVQLDHRVQSVPVFPAALFMNWALGAAAEAFGPGRHALTDFQFSAALATPENKAAHLQLALAPAPEDLPGEIACSFLSRPADAADDEVWTANADGAIELGGEDDAPELKHETPAALQARLTATDDADRFYQLLAGCGLDYGPAFRGVEALWSAPEGAECLARIRARPLQAGAPGAPLNAAALDAALQPLVALGLRRAAEEQPPSAFVPVQVRRLAVHAAPTPDQTLWAHARIASGSPSSPLLPGGAKTGPANPTPDQLTGDVSIVDDDGRVLVEIGGVRLQRLERGALADDFRDWLYETKWLPAPSDAQAAKPLDAGAPATSHQPPATDNNDWLIFADEGGLGERLAQELEARGGRCVLARAGGEFAAPEAGRATVDPERPEDFERLLNAADGAARVAYLWALDAADAFVEADDVAAFAAAQRRCLGGALQLAQALAKAEGAASALYLITSGAQATAAVDAPGGQTGVGANPLQAALWGLGRTVAVEHPELHCRLIDLDSAAASDDALALCDELLLGARDAMAEAQVALRGATRLVARLTRADRRADRESAPGLAAPKHRPFQLDQAQRGVLDSFQLTATDRQPPAAGEIEIRVRASGLNFRDVWVGLGMNPGGGELLGLECAGTVTAVGAGVADFRPGDEVFAFAPGSFASFVTTRAKFAALKPPALSFEAAAGLPIVFLTAHYALRELAKLRAGDRVLIHAAAGGVGLAAVQLARRAGAEIFGTAGSPRKRELLASLGVRRVMDSRSLDFAEELMEATDGRGVDVVLNSLAGEFIPKSLLALAENGRFIEIGKTGVWTADQARAVKPDCEYHRFDLIEVAESDPPAFQKMLWALGDEFATGALAPPPLSVFPIEQAAEAFRTMSEARHVGKLVLTQSPTRSREVARPAAPLFRADGAYLITGGLRGLGLLVARWMAERGAGRLALMGRGAPSAETQRELEEIRQLGAEVVVVQGDAANPNDVQRAIELSVASQPLAPNPQPLLLRGVIHSAGVLDDGMLPEQNWERFAKVLGPKVAGAWNLHRLTRGQPLDWFVTFSSWTCVVGSPGQANHTAANAFMDALAHYRRARGLPGLSVNWGAWAEVGAAAQDDRGERLAARGLGMFSPAQGLAALEHLLKTAGQSSPQVAVAAFDLARWKAASPESSWRLAELLESAPDAAASTAQEPAADAGGVLEQLRAAPSARRRQTLLEDCVRRQVARVLRLPESRIDPRRPFKALGLDSLTALELRNRLESALELSLPATLIWSYPTTVELAAHLAENIGGAEEEPAAPEDDTELVDILQELEELSDEEAQQLLADDAEAENETE